METVEKRKRGVAALYAHCPVAHIIAAVSGIVIALHLLLRGRQGLMAAVSRTVVRPVHRALSQLCSHVGFSVAELLIGCFAALIVVYITIGVARIIRTENKLGQVYIIFIRLLAAGLCVYGGFCLLWGAYYYGDDFATASGLDDSEISTEELETVTVYFAQRLNEYGELVTRDGSGLYTVDREALLADSDRVFAAVEEDFPCLAGPAVRAKGIRFSRVMSYLDFTGFFFPFTAEANVNMDFPPALFAATVAHELSHQRGVAKEQEANFTAVLAALEYGDIDYCYSACMLAYTHLGNALYGADRGAWQMVSKGLSEKVRLDMSAGQEYWKQFETPVQTVSNTVYEGFLQSYDQKLGLQSYGACVDLLVNYYIDEAEAFYG